MAETWIETCRQKYVWLYEIVLNSTSWSPDGQHKNNDKLKDLLIFVRSKSVRAWMVEPRFSVSQ